MEDDDVDLQENKRKCSENYVQSNKNFQCTACRWSGKVGRAGPINFWIHLVDSSHIDDSIESQMKQSADDQLVACDGCKRKCQLKDMCRTTAQRHLRHGC